MRVLLQRVSEARVSVGGSVVGMIGRGLVVFVGVASGDSEKDAQYLARKTINLRIFEYEDSKFNLSAMDAKAELLVVSKFTLLADARKGRRPSFSEAAPPAQAEALFKSFVAGLQTSGLKVENKAGSAETRGYQAFSCTPGEVRRAKCSLGNSHISLKEGQ